MTGRVRDPAKAAEAVRLRGLGWKYAEISEQTGLSVNGVWSACNRERARELKRLCLARTVGPVVVCPTCGHRKRQRRDGR